MHTTAIEWSSDQARPVDRTDAWEDVLSRSYRPWQVAQRLPANFFAHVRRRDFAGLDIVETVCDPCSGERTGRQVRQDEEVYVGVQLTTEGRERFRIGDAGVEVGSGDVVVWTSDRQARFEVIERLRKLTLMIPWSLMREYLPVHKQPPCGGKVDTRTGVGSLLAVHLRALSSEMEGLDRHAQGSVSRATFELLNVVLFGQQPSAHFDASVAMRRRVQDFILRHLHEERLSPAGIARHNHISLRYLHLLFQGSGTTVSAYILEKRLQACRQALTDPACRHLQIAEIAYRWGFSSTSHFCRTFKKRYGFTAGDVRLLGDVPDGMGGLPH